ncbi:MAG: beta-galactosidase, partial [Armatimonadetes bacterium]|nr:beta-galactosidase [Armatimonadota bacterium]
DMLTGAMLVSLSLSLSLAWLGAPADDEFIRVAPDHWTFEGARSHERFLPLGTSFVFGDRKYLNLFGPDVYNRELYDRALAALEGVQVNIVRVFLPIAQVLPDPQEPGTVRIAPGYLDNLADFLALARRHHIRVVVAMTSWGGNTIKWWHEGGEYFGRKPWRQTDGIDSLDVLRRFWTTLCRRFADDPTIFAWTPTVEWGFPASNLTWTPPNKQYGRLETEPGLFYWRAFLRAGYGGDINRLNRVYGTEYRDFAEVPIVDFTYLPREKRYADPDAKILDYQNFREWASMRYLRPQIEAIRRADANHMVTISNHSRRAIGLWPGAARYFIGFSVPEQADLVDYLTTHDNVSESKLRPEDTLEDVVHREILRTRFCCARKVLPVMIEEFTFASKNPERMAEGQEEMVMGSVGHAFGWMNWYMQYADQPGSADTPDYSAILDRDLKPTAWGRRLPELRRRLEHADLSRKPAQTVLEVERAQALVPKEMGLLLHIGWHWDEYQHPVDFHWPRNPFINLRLLGE